VDTDHPLAIGAAGAGVEVTGLRVWRDAYYLDPQGLPRPWKMSAPQVKGEFALLGDNQPVSIDSRTWEAGWVGRRAILGLVCRAPWARERH
jgi:hypothetical protein